MIKFRHNTCTSHLISYIGHVPLSSNPPMKSSNWQMPNGDVIKPDSKRYLACPDCGEDVGITRRSLSEIVVK